MASIRRATADDAALILEMISALAEHHRQADAVRTNEDILSADGAGDTPRFGALIAEVDGAAAGFLSYTICYSIWRGASFMQIDDVFVHDEYRGMGLGEALMKESHRVCRELGLNHLKWEVQPDNAGAIRFYDRIGAKGYDKRLYRWVVE